MRLRCSSSHFFHRLSSATSNVSGSTHHSHIAIICSNRQQDLNGLNPQPTSSKAPTRSSKATTPASLNILRIQTSRSCDTSGRPATMATSRGFSFTFSVMRMKLKLPWCRIVTSAPYSPLSQRAPHPFVPHMSIAPAFHPLRIGPGDSDELIQRAVST